MNIGKAIRECRERHKVKQTHLAKAAGITGPSLSCIESGRNQPTALTVTRIAAALKVSEAILWMAAMEPKDVRPEMRVEFELIYPHIHDMLMRLLR